jgi:hypothetical protein
MYTGVRATAIYYEHPPAILTRCSIRYKHLLQPFSIFTRDVEVDVLVRFAERRQIEAVTRRYAMEG